jgi:biotin carboxyl carrier protein
MKRKYIAISIALLLVLGAGALIKNKSAKNNRVSALKTEAVVVKSFALKEQKAILTKSSLALVKNDSDTMLSAKSNAAILMIKPSGTKVRAGDTVAILDARELKAKRDGIISSISAAKEEAGAKELALINEEASHKRTLELLAVKGASIEQSQSEESRIALLKADLKGAKAKLLTYEGQLADINSLIEYSTLKATADGVVGETFANMGEIAIVGKPIVSIKANKGAYLLVRVAADNPVKTVIYDSKEYELKFLQNSNGLDEYRANLNIGLPSGSRVEVKTVSFKDNGIFAPRDALLQKEGKSYIFEIDNEKIKAEEVSVVAEGDEGFVIKGANTGKKIALAKPDILLRLLGGAAVKVKE